MLRNLFEKFGATFELGQFYPAYERKLNAVEPDWLVPGSKGALVDDATFIALCYWCEGRDRDAKTYAAECVKHAIEYFFGKWREEIPTDLKTLDSSWWRIHSTWVTPFREALCWATTLADWKSVRRLAEYPTSETKPGVDATREDAAAYLALACFLRETPVADYEHYFALIEKGKKEKPKLLAAVIRSFQAKDSTEFQRTLESYLRYFRKSEFKKTSLEKLLCLDGTTLLNVGLHTGLAFNVPTEVEDHIIRLK